MRLGFHYHIPVKRIGDQIFTSGYFGCFLDSIAEKCERLTCFMHTPVDNENEIMDYSLKNENVALIDIGPHKSVPKRVLSIPKVKIIIRNEIDNIDLMLVRGPSPLLPVFVSSFKNKPIALLLVGDVLAGIDGLPQPKWRKELIRIWSMYNSSMQLKAARQNLTFVNSHLLYELFVGKVPNLIETRTTTLSINDFFYREDTCQNKRINLLFTGRMSRSKGILDIIEAVKILVAQGENLYFDLVGMLDKSEPILDEINHLAIDYGLSDRIKFHGYKPLGAELFHFYKQADIYILASQSSFEGFPRTIWEAMAHSLPVIATRVGSIPDYIEGAALLISPRLPQDLAKAISQLISDQEIRKKNIRKGYLLAQQNTLEIRAKEMITHMEQYLDNVKHD